MRLIRFYFYVIAFVLMVVALANALSGDYLPAFVWLLFAAIVYLSGREITRR